MGQCASVLQSFLPSGSQPIEVNREGSLTCVTCTCCNNQYDKPKHPSIGQRKKGNQSEKKTTRRGRRMASFLFRTRSTSPPRSRWFILMDWLRTKKGQENEKSKARRTSKERHADAEMVGVSDDLRSASSCS